VAESSHLPPSGITFLAGFDRDLRQGLAAEIRALWTHHSTALEGNTLTLGDTAFVLQEGLTVSGKSLKDHQEVIGHARALDLVYALVDRRQPVTAALLHELHRAVQTEVVSDVFAPIGRWKVEPNGTTALLSAGGTRWHDYAAPAHVPVLMDDWLAQLDVARQGLGGDPVAVYATLHLGFAAIHPYADGNGRLARLLANVPLLTGGEPPILVPLERRREYLTLLGDWSIARGAPRPGEALVPASPERKAVEAFFTSVASLSRDLVATYRERQRLRHAAR